MPMNFYKIMLKRFVKRCILSACFLASFLSSVRAEDFDLVFVQIPIDAAPQADQGIRHPAQRYVDGCRIVAKLAGENEVINLTPEFVSALDPAVSFDGNTILFAGKKDAADSWQIWQMKRDGSEKELIIGDLDFCVSPLYVGSIFHLNDEKPIEQIVFVSADHGWINEWGAGEAFSLYVANWDGSNPRRISFNLSSDFAPEVLPNGRLVYSSGRWNGASAGEVVLQEVNIDGTDLMLFYGADDKPAFREMARVSQAGRVYFVESKKRSWLGGGDLACVSLRRPLFSYEVVASGKGIFHSPCPMVDSEGREILYVSYRADEDEPFGIYNHTDGMKPVVKAEAWHCVDAQGLRSHPLVKGRSTVVDDNRDVGNYFCLNAYFNNRPNIPDIEKGKIKRVRVLEGLPIYQTSIGDDNHDSKPHSAPKRILGELDIEPDGSFFIQVPSELPISFQILDDRGMALQSQQSWSWVMPRESRGCIGCHETPEMAPPNVMVKAIEKPALQLIPPPKERRVVDFKHDIAPILEAKCSATNCHADGVEKPYLDAAHGYENLLTAIDGRENEKYVHAGWAINSPLIWHLYGERLNSADPQIEYSSDITLMPPDDPLTDEEKRLLIEWIDLGAHWDSHTISNHVTQKQKATIQGGDLW